MLRLTLSVGLALCLGFVFTPLGCGGSNEWTVVPSRAVNDDPPVPPATYAAVLACATAAQGRLTDRVYRLGFDVEVTESGEASRVELRDASPGERGLETCVGHALEGMALPLSVLGPVATERAVSPASRGLMGQGVEEAAGAAINLAPIYLAVAAVAVVVVVAVHYTGKAIDARRRRKSKEQCINMYVDCDARGYPCTIIVDSGASLCRLCLANCIDNKPYKFTECTQCGFK